jgi:thiol-disulfide isomerase/thioredoxin
LVAIFVNKIYQIEKLFNFSLFDIFIGFCSDTLVYFRVKPNGSHLSFQEYDTRPTVMLFHKYNSKFASYQKNVFSDQAIVEKMNQSFELNLYGNDVDRLGLMKLFYGIWRTPHFRIIYVRNDGKMVKLSKKSGYVSQEKLLKMLDRSLEKFSGLPAEKKMQTSKFPPLPPMPTHSDTVVYSLNPKISKIDELYFEAKGRPVLLYFTNVGCGPCREFERLVLRDSVNSMKLKDYYVVKIDDKYSQGLEVRKKFGIKAFPTFYVAQPEGKSYSTRKFFGFGKPASFFQELAK